MPSRVCHHVCAITCVSSHQLVGSFKLYVSSSKEPCKRDCILQKRLMILRSLHLSSDVGRAATETVALLHTFARHLAGDTHLTILLHSYRIFPHIHRIRCMWVKILYQCNGMLTWVWGGYDSRLLKIISVHVGANSV